MNSLEFIKQHIEEVQTSIKAFELDYELYHREGDKRDAEKLKQILNHLQQIKTKLEAYETGKEQDYTLEQVKKEWEELGYEWFKDKICIKLINKEDRDIDIHIWLSDGDYTKGYKEFYQYITFQEHQLLTKTLKALGRV